MKANRILNLVVGVLGVAASLLMLLTGRETAGSCILNRKGDLNMEDTSLKDQELENVSGGEFRTVNTGDSRDAAIRAYPALNAPVIAVLPNGTAANSTGKFTYADGRNWAEIDYPVRGWIKGAILGYAY